MEGKLWQTLDSIVKKQSHHFAYQGPYSQNYGFPSSHVQMWELDHQNKTKQNNNNNNKNSCG